jgi:hypothetical protein
MVASAADPAPAVVLVDEVAVPAPPSLVPQPPAKTAQARRMKIPGRKHPVALLDWNFFIFPSSLRDMPVRSDG